jgi:hypothetical protein
MTIVRYVRHAREFTIDTDELSSLDYLLQNGWSQSLQDVCAGVWGKVWDELAAETMKGMGLVAADPKKAPFAEFEAYLKANPDKAKIFEAAVDETAKVTEVSLIEKRIDAIIANKVGTRAGQGGDAVEVEIRALARANLPAYVKSRGFKMPKDTESKNALLDEYIELVRDTLRPAAEANVKTKAALAEALAASIPTP